MFQGVKYIFHRDTGRCQGEFLDPTSEHHSLEVENGLIRMKRPAAFFYIDQGNYQYTGQVCFSGVI